VVENDTVIEGNYACMHRGKLQEVTLDYVAGVMTDANP
jgi:hypothetical protein